MARVPRLSMLNVLSFLAESCQRGDNIGLGSRPWTLCSGIALGIGKLN